MKPVKNDNEIFFYENYIFESSILNLDESLAWLELMDQMENILSIADCVGG